MINTSFKNNINPFWGADWAEIKHNWILDPDITFLNNGSFGATPRVVLDTQQMLREQLESEPVTFLYRRLPEMLEHARINVGHFLNANPNNLVFVPNATTGVNTVINSLAFKAGDEILTTNHAYPAILNTLKYVCEKSGATLVIQDVDFPADGDLAKTADTILEKINNNTRILVMDHITSPTGLIFPIDKVISVCRSRGILTVIDAAHTPGMLPVDLSDENNNPDFWTGNFHKWVYAPKSAAALYIHPQHTGKIRPLITSLFHGNGLQEEFSWMGTYDPTAYLSVPAGIDFMNSLGVERVMQHNRKLVRYGQQIVSEALGTSPPVPDQPDLYGAMALIALPAGRFKIENQNFGLPLMDKLYEAYNIEVPFTCFNGNGFIRISAQVFNQPDDYQYLASVINKFLDNL